MTNTKFIVYQSQLDYHEVIVTTPELEESVIHEYFNEGGRDLDEYERTEHTDSGITITVGNLRIQ
jgi:hypothetical protein